MKNNRQFENLLDSKHSDVIIVWSLQIKKIRFVQKFSFKVHSEMAITVQYSNDFHKTFHIISGQICKYFEQ